jgi:predicted acetyltransferase
MNLQEAINSSKQYLSSDLAIEIIERDPYWPKWNSPWWHMRLLQEMNLAKEIPKIAIDKMVDVLKKHYLPIFPIHKEELPDGTDPFRKIACHCAVGSMYQVLFYSGVDIDFELPWMRPWMLRYQLPDGGLNCDEQAYTKPIPKSSIVTTLNCLEAIFFCRNRNLTDEELKFLKSGADYLLAHQLFRKKSDGQVIDKDWLEIRFPRFYEYDFFRGYYFLVKWSEFCGRILPSKLVDEVSVLVSRQISQDGIFLKRYNLFDKRSYNPMPDGSWEWGIASEFDLFKTVSQNGLVCESLTHQWKEIKGYSIIKLARPSLALYPSFLEFFDEMKSHNQPLWNPYTPRVEESAEQFIKRLNERESAPEAPLVPETIYWAVYDDHVVGRISLRHRLEGNLHKMGGHIGYEVGPKWRKRDFATEMLRLLLLTVKAKEIGRVLLTCSPTNEASNKTIIRNGGIFDKTVFVDSIEEARLLDGRSIAHGYAGPQKEWLSSQGYFKKTKLTSEPIIIDGNIITCRPDRYIDFAITVAQLAGCFRQERGEILKNYYRGMNS